MTFNELILSFETLKQLRQSIYDELFKVTDANNNKIDMTLKTAGDATSIAEIDTKVAAICELGVQLKKGVDPFLIPIKWLTEIKSNLDEITRIYQSIKNSLEQIKNNGGYGIFIPENQALKSKNGEINLPLRSIFKSIETSVESLLVTINWLWPKFLSQGTDVNLSVLLQGFVNLREEAQREKTEIDTLVKEMRSFHKKASELVKNSESHFNEISRFETESDKNRKTLGEYEAEGTQKITNIKIVSEQTEILKVQVDQYKAAFENFQKNLDGREKNLAEFQERQSRVLSDIAETKSKIDNLCVNAEAMLSGATIAGLAGSFGELRDRLTNDLRWARGFFFFAIAFLSLSVFPLGIYVIPGLSSWLGIPAAPLGAGTALEFLGQIGSRLLLIFPAAWLAKFAAKNYEDLFRLKEHYTYKYSLASSVENFKKQAAFYQEDITAATFFELTFNPVERLSNDDSAARSPNPVMEELLRKMKGKEKGANNLVSPLT